MIITVLNSLLEGGNALSYELREKDEKWFSVSKCFTDDAFSLLTASDLSDYLSHTEEKNDGMTLQQYVKSSWQVNFADMVVCDYVLANTDRHLENWGFLVNNRTQEITSFAPLYDMNQALLVDYIHNSLDGLIYQPTDTTYKEVDQLKLSLKYSKCYNDIDDLEQAKNLREAASDLQNTALGEYYFKELADSMTTEQIIDSIDNTMGKIVLGYYASNEAKEVYDGRADGVTITGLPLVYAN